MTVSRRMLIAGAAFAPFAARAETVLRAGDQKGGAQSVMRAAGALENLAYRIEWSQFAAAAPVLEALNAGAVDFALAGDAPTTFALAAGVPAHIIGAVRSGGAGTAIVVPAGSPIRTVADLRGRRVATNRGSIGHDLVLALIAAQGWEARDLPIVNLLPAEAKGALANGAVDAWCSWGVYIAQARVADGARVVVDGSGGLRPTLSYTVASDEAIARRRDALMDFSRRLATARRWALANPADAARALAAEIGVSEPVARLTLDSDAPAPAPIDATMVADEQRTADRYLGAGVIRGRVEAARLFDASFNAALS